MSEQAGDKPEDGQANGTNEDEEVIFPEEEAEDERTDLEKAHAERDRMREQLLRIAADFDNFRKRSRKEIEEVRRRTVEDTLREVLPIVDNLERAAGAMTDATEVSAVTEGVHMVLRGFEDIASRLGLKRVATVGNLFDPTCHDAMQQEETDEHAPGTIVAEIVPGYYLGERLLRPAMVVVAKPPTGRGDQGGESSTDGDGASE
jgi:molecular chaperone GrpE